MIVLGIDPGCTGAVTAIDGDGVLMWAVRTPLIADDYDMRAMLSLLRVDGIVAIEAVGAARVEGRQQGGSSMFAFGRGYGIWLGLIAASGLPRIDVKPQAWTRELLAGMPKADDPKKRAAQRKQNAVTRALAMWPTLPIKFKRDWAMADACLVAEYARRQHVGQKAIAQ